LTELDVGRMIAALEEAVAAGLLREVEIDRFAFAHVLIREALYQRQSASRRARTHYKIAEALQVDAAAPPAEIAHHLFASGHLDRAGKAIAYATLAGERAEAALAYEQAAGHYRRALAALAEDADPRLRCDLLLALGGAEQRSGDPEARASYERAAQVARAEGLSTSLATAALGVAGRYVQGSILDERAASLLEEALAVLGERDDALVVKLLARLVTGRHFHDAGIAELSAEALAIAGRLGDPAALIAALQARHAALLHIEHLDERLVISRRLLSMAQQTGDRELETLARHWQNFDFVEAGELAAARSGHAALVRLADAVKQPVYRYIAVVWEGMWAQTEDRLEDAGRLIAEAQELATRTTDREVDIDLAAAGFVLLYRNGQLAFAIEALEAMARERPTYGVYRPALAVAHTQAGDLVRAAREFESVARDGFRDVPRNLLWLNAICMLAEVCAALGDNVRAPALYELLLPYRHRFVLVGVATCWGSVERWLGLLARAMGQRQTAVAHLEAALAANATAGVRSTTHLIERELSATAPRHAR
jgi:tetratricopeptide (TPR) repeat protein